MIKATCVGCLADKEPAFQRILLDEMMMIY
jgi:hypothetical protein